MTETIVIADLTVEELANRLLDELRVDVDAAKLDTGLDADGQKFLAAVRKMAHEDPQAIADGFVAMSLDAAAMEEQLQMMKQLMLQKLDFTQELINARPEEQN